MGGGGSSNKRLQVLLLSLSGLLDQEVDTVFLNARLRLLKGLLRVGFWCDWQGILRFRQLLMREVG